MTLEILHTVLAVLIGAVMLFFLTVIVWVLINSTKEKTKEISKLVLGTTAVSVVLGLICYVIGLTVLTVTGIS